MLNSLLLSSNRYILDIYPGATGAWWLFKLKSSYSGSCIRVRRSSDNAEQDIGFLGNVLDTSSLLSFCGAGNGFIVTWYDQSGNGFNLTQATAGSQMQLVSSGVVNTSGSNNRPVALPDQAQWYVSSSNLGITGNPALTCIAVASQEGTNIYSTTGSYGVDLSAASFFFPFKNGSTVTQVGLGFNSSVNYGYYTYTNNSTMASHIWTHTAGATGAGNVGNVGYLNGVSQTITSAGSGTPNLSNAKFYLGAYVNNAATYAMKGKLAGYIFYGSTELTQDQTSGIYNILNSYYGL